MRRYFILGLILGLPAIYATWETVHEEYLHQKRMRKIYNTAGYLEYRLAKEEARMLKEKEKLKSAIAEKGGTAS